MTTPGKNWPTFLCLYRYNGKEYSIEFPAEGWADAEGRLQAIHFGRVEGILHQTLPANPVTGVWVRWITFWRNLRRHG